jgi:hypothetical protein
LALEEEVRSVCKLIEDVVVPFITEEMARLSNGKQTIIEAIVQATQRYMGVSRSGDPSDQGS